MYSERVVVFNSHNRCIKALDENYKNILERLEKKRSHAIAAAAIAQW